MFAINHRRRSSSVTRRGRQVPITEQLEVRALMTSWVGQIGGAGTESVQSRAVLDSAGNMYVGGFFMATADFDTNQATSNLTSAGDSDAFVAKYSSAGNLIWARQFGGIGADVTNGLRLDPSEGSLYLTGTFTGSADFTGDGAPDLTSAGGSDVFVVKLNPATGSTVWQKSVGGASTDNGYDIVAINNRVFIAGDFKNTADFNPSATINSLTSAGKGSNRLSDGFILTLTDTGTYVSVWQVGGAYEDTVTGLAADGNNIYASGQIKGTVDIDPTSSVYSINAPSSAYSMFIASYSSTGKANWGKLITGSIPANVAYLGNDNGSLYLTGEFGTTANFNVNGSGGNLTCAGTVDAFIAKYSMADGGFAWAQKYGGAGYDTVRGAAVVNPADGSVFVGGWYKGDLDFNPGPGNGGEVSNAGGTDNFILQLEANGSYRNSWRMGGAENDGAAKPVGVLNNTLYVTGRFQLTADFPTGTTLSSFGSLDAFVMAIDLPGTAPFLTTTSSTQSVEQPLSVTDYQSVSVNSQGQSLPTDSDTSVMPRRNTGVQKLGSIVALSGTADYTAVSAAPLIDAVFSQLTIRDLDLFGTLLSRHR